MPRLSPRERNNAIGRLQAGQSQQAVANVFNVSRQTINSLWARFNTFGDVADRPRAGRPRVTTPGQDRYIRLRHLRNRFTTSTSTASQVPGLRRISDQTVRNRLREGGLFARRPVRRNVLTPRHIRERLQWCQQRLRWQQRLWNQILFTDESRFLLTRGDGRARVYRRANERYARNCVQQVDRFGGGSIMVWGGIQNGRRTQLVRIDGALTGLRYRDEILLGHVVPFINMNGGQLQQDNARPHIARVCVDFLQRNNIQVLPWPARSPDLSPIEHIWDDLDRRVRQRDPPPQTLNQLFQALEEEWQNIPQARLRNLIMSMGRRCTAVIAANGGHTRY